MTQLGHLQSKHCDRVTCSQIHLLDDNRTVLKFSRLARREDSVKKGQRVRQIYCPSHPRQTKMISICASKDYNPAYIEIGKCPQDKRLDDRFAGQIFRQKQTRGIVFDVLTTITDTEQGHGLTIEHTRR